MANLNSKAGSKSVVLDRLVCMGLPTLPVSQFSVLPKLMAAHDLPPLPQIINHQVQISLNDQKSDKFGNLSLSHISCSDQVSNPMLEHLGLPKLPVGFMTQLIATSTSVGSPNKSSHNSLRAVRSISELYAGDNSHLNRVLEVTSMLIDRMPPTVATDCLVEMPGWMRNIYLARHGVSRVLGLMLAERLNAAGEGSLVDSDGFVEIHTVQGPHCFQIGSSILTNSANGRNCSLKRLTVNAKSRSRGIIISSKPKKQTAAILETI